MIELAKNQHEHSKGEHENSDELRVKFSAARWLVRARHLFAADRLTEIKLQNFGGEARPAYTTTE